MAKQTRIGRIFIKAEQKSIIFSRFAGTGDGVIVRWHFPWKVSEIEDAPIDILSVTQWIGLVFEYIVGQLPGFVSVEVDVSLPLGSRPRGTLYMVIGVGGSNIDVQAQLAALVGDNVIGIKRVKSVDVDAELDNATLDVEEELEEAFDKYSNALIIDDPDTASKSIKKLSKILALVFSD